MPDGAKVLSRTYQVIPNIVFVSMCLVSILVFFKVSHQLQDLKDEKQRAKIATARAVVEKCTMMLLTASKVL